MEPICKLPLMLGCLAALAGGIAGYASGMASSEIYIRMAVLMVAFFVLGLYIRNNIISVKKEVKEKKKIEALKEYEESRRKKEEEMEKMMPKMSSGATQGSHAQKLDGQGEAEPEMGKGEDDDFVPLNISKAIRTKISE